MMTTKYGVLLGLMVLIGLVATPGRAQVSVNVHIGEPPPVIVEPAPVIVQAPPTMILLPEPQMYVAVGVPYDIYFVGGRYYYLQGGHWFWGSGYAGPWTYVAVQQLPPGLRKFKVKELHDYREREYKVYRAAGPSFGGTYFVAEERGHPGEGHGKAKGKGHGRGRGHGNEQ